MRCRAILINRFANRAVSSGNAKSHTTQNTNSLMYACRERECTGCERTNERSLMCASTCRQITCQKTRKTEAEKTLPQLRPLGCSVCHGKRRPTLTEGRTRQLRRWMKRLSRSET